MKQTKSPIRNSILYSLILISLLIGSISLASVSSLITTGPVIAYTKLNCTGDSELFVSPQELQHHVLEHGTYYSYHAEHNKRPCVNFVEMDLFTGSINPNLSAFPSRPPEPSINSFIAMAWSQYLQETCDCWRSKADAKGVSYDNHDYRFTMILGETTQGNLY
jgi:hypothetical protein